MWLLLLWFPAMNVKPVILAPMSGSGFCSHGSQLFPYGSVFGQLFGHAPVTAELNSPVDLEYTRGASVPLSISVYLPCEIIVYCCVAVPTVPLTATGHGTSL